MAYLTATNIFDSMVGTFNSICGYNPAWEKADKEKVEYLVSSDTYSPSFLLAMWQAYLNDSDTDSPCFKVFFYAKNMARFSQQAYFSNVPDKPDADKRKAFYYRCTTDKCAHWTFLTADEIEASTPPEYMSTPCKICGGKMRRDWRMR